MHDSGADGPARTPDLRTLESIAIEERHIDSPAAHITATPMMVTGKITRTRKLRLKDTETRNLNHSKHSVLRIVVSRF